MNRSNRVQHIAPSTESFNQINMDILEQIVETKKNMWPIVRLYIRWLSGEKYLFSNQARVTFRYILRDDKVGIIAEIKKKISFERHFRE